MTFWPKVPVPLTNVSIVPGEVRWHPPSLSEIFFTVIRFDEESRLQFGDKKTVPLSEIFDEEKNEVEGWIFLDIVKLPVRKPVA